MNLEAAKIRTWLAFSDRDHYVQLAALFVKEKNLFSSLFLENKVLSHAIPRLCVRRAVDNPISKGKGARLCLTKYSVERFWKLRD